MSNFNHPEWTKDKNIYEVNLRQYTQEGDIKAFMNHLPRLKKMGVDILWLMPIHPIGEKERKGTLGSQYAVKDYLALDPSLGTKEDLKALIDQAHDMYVPHSRLGR
ncbi:1,4-alpha-glucan branching enzyme [Vibrio astriarenae]|nr:1,4-alpha-glucan branching enzyme [Vibrio sp. C7]